MTKKNSALGRALIKGKKVNRSHRASKNHTTDLNDGYDWTIRNLQSITEQNDLDEFLATAELAGTDFTAEKLNIEVITSFSRPGVLTEEETKTTKQLHEQYRSCLRIPRRPLWDSTTTAEELDQKERETFIEWRKSLADLQETKGIKMTPFEKNLEFWRQLWRVIERSDCVVQIVDARNPLLFYCEDLTQYVKEVNDQKTTMLLLNKADYLTREQREKWAKYFDSIGQRAVLFSALEEASNESSVESPKKLDELAANSAELWTKDELIELFRTCHSGVKVKDGMTTIGLVGYPNVGKSSTINAIIQSKKVSVSNTPGKTKHFQTIHLGEDLCLCDCPGLVFPNFVANKASMILNGILPIDQLTDHVPPVNLLLSVIPRHVLEKTYGIMIPQPSDDEDPDRPPTSEELLNAYGYMRGYMTQSGQPDNPRSSRYILKDFVTGKLLYCVAPPGVDQEKFHIFPDPPDKKSTEDPLHLRHTKERKTTTKDVDKDFFKMKGGIIHTLGKMSVGGQSTVTASQNSLNGKPWKKHNNRNKREKLKRLYPELNP